MQAEAIATEAKVEADRISARPNMSKSNPVKALDSEGNIAMETSRHEGIRHRRKWILESHPRNQRLKTTFLTFKISVIFCSVSNCGPIIGGDVFGTNIPKQSMYIYFSVIFLSV
jgi:hypothetical protein